MSEPFDISEVTFIKRIIIGNKEPQNIQDDTVQEHQMEFLNHCLNDYPRGKIVGQEKGFHILRVGEHQIVMQYVVYHVGFKRRPNWIE